MSTQIPKLLAPYGGFGTKKYNRKKRSGNTFPRTFPSSRSWMGSSEPRMRPFPTLVPATSTTLKCNATPATRAIKSPCRWRNISSWTTGTTPQATREWARLSLSNTGLTRKRGRYSICRISQNSSAYASRALCHASSVAIITAPSCMMR